MVYYHDINEKEVITWFSFTEMVITDLLGLYATGKAQFYVRALEDNVIYKISKHDLEELYRKYLMFYRHNFPNNSNALICLAVSMFPHDSRRKLSNRLLAVNSFPGKNVMLFFNAFK